MLYFGQVLLYGWFLLDLCSYAVEIFPTTKKKCLVYSIIGKCEIGIYCSDWILHGYVSADIGGCWVVSHSQPRVPGAWDAGVRQVVSELEVWKTWVLREVGSDLFWTKIGLS